MVSKRERAAVERRERESKHGMCTVVHTEKGLKCWRRKHDSTGDNSTHWAMTNGRRFFWEQTEDGITYMESSELLYMPATSQR